MERCFGNSNASIDYSIWLLKRPSDNKGTYNFPTCDEVAAVFSSSGDGCPPYSKGIEIHSKNGQTIKLKIDSPHTDPMTYPILYPFGKGGWSSTLQATGSYVEENSDEEDVVGNDQKKKRNSNKKIIYVRRILDLNRMLHGKIEEK